MVHGRVGEKVQKGGVRMTMDELSRLLDKTEALEKYKDTKNEMLALRGELSKYKNLKIMFAGEEISLETFEKKASEQTMKVYGEEIERKMEYTLRTRSLWPPWFEQQVDNVIKDGIKKGLDEAFSLKVQAAINNAKMAEWPIFLEEYTRTRITPVCQRLIQNHLVKAITIQKVCNKCGTVMTVSLTPSHIAELIKSPQLLIECPNPGCRDLFLKHKLPITLGDVLIHIAETSQP
jgi:hypothetical protein